MKQEFFTIISNKETVEMFITKYNTRCLKKRIEQIKLNYNIVQISHI